MPGKGENGISDSLEIRFIIISDLNVVDFLNVKTNLSLFFNSKCYSSKCVCLLRFPPHKYDNPFRIPCDILYEPKTLF